MTGGFVPISGGESPQEILRYCSLNIVKIITKIIVDTFISYSQQLHTVTLRMFMNNNVYPDIFDKMVNK